MSRYAGLRRFDLRAVRRTLDTLYGDLEAQADTPAEDQAKWAVGDAIDAIDRALKALAA
jgi:hypothetical protein